MSKSIDEKIVELHLDNKNFERNTDSSLKAIDRLKKGLRFKDSEKGFDKITKSANSVDISNIARGVEHLQKRMSVMGVIGATIIQNLTNKILDFGRKAADALVLTPITSGFEEFELKMGAIQTIMAGSGEDLETVNNYLNELNTYADKTIYSFSDMTQNIGKFTNAGVDLEQSVAAIKGIANVAAISGANSNEASRAMYNFAQALSAGHVKLIDWKSIELANMGTVEFKQQLIDAAVAAGTLTDAGDGFYKTAEGKMLSATKGFNEALTDAWLTSEVLVSTLNDYSDVTTDIGKRATAAAQDIKTFSMLLDTLKEALQSGWAFSWELIIGDFEEGKALFTEVGEILGNMIGNSAELRNTILKDWKDLGGRDDLVTTLRTALELFRDIRMWATGARREIFGTFGGSDLKKISENLLAFFERIKMALSTEEGSNRMRDTFKSLFAILDIGRKIVGSFARSFVKFLRSFGVTNEDILKVVDKVNEFILRLHESIGEGEVFDKFFDDVFGGLKKVIDGITIGIGAVVMWFKSLNSTKIEIDFSVFGEWMDSFKQKLRGFGKAGEIFAGIIDSVGNAIGWLRKKTQPAREAIQEFFAGVREWVKDAVSNLEFDSVQDALNKGLLGGVLLSLRGFFTEGKKILGGGLFVAILKSIKDFIDSGGSVFNNISNVLDGVGDTLKAYQKQLKANTLLKIAGAIGLLALSIFALSLIDGEKLTMATLAIATLFAALIQTLEVFSKMAGGAKKMVTLVVTLIGIAGAILILSGALAIISKMDPEGIASGVLAIGGLLAGLAIFVKNVGGGKKMIGVGIGLMIMADAITVLAFSLKVISDIEVDDMKQSLMALGGAMVILALAVKLFPKNAAGVGVGLFVVAGSLHVLVGALKKFGELNPEQLRVGLTSIAAVLLILAGSLKVMTGSMGGAAALLVASGALVIVGLALKTIGALPIENIGKALLGIVGVFVILGLAGSILAPTVPVLLALGAAMLLIGVAAFAIGAGVGAFATGLLTLVTIGAAGAATLGVIITTLATLLPFIATQLAEALVAFVETIAGAGPRLLEALIKLIKVALEAFRTTQPLILEAILDVVTSLLQTIADHLPDIIQAGFDILIGFLEGIRDNSGEVVRTGYDIMIELMDAIGEKVPELVDAGFKMVIDFIDGLAEAFEENTPTLIRSVANLGTSIITGIIEGMLGAVGDLWSEIWDIGGRIISEFAEALGIESPSEETKEQSKHLMSGFVVGIKTFASRVFSAAGGFGRDLISKFSDATSSVASLVDSDMDVEPTITPVMDMSNFDKSKDDMEKFFKDFDPSAGAAGLAASISSTIDSKSATGETVNPKADGSDPAIQFIQNNYSPKALTPIEIYRQTNNQLRKLKGVTP